MTISDRPRSIGRQHHGQRHKPPWSIHSQSTVNPQSTPQHWRNNAITGLEGGFKGVCAPKDATKGIFHSP